MRLLFFLFALSGFAEEITSITVPINGSESLRISHVTHASIANGKIAKARELAHRILVTGVSVGETMLRAWTSDGKEHAFVVKVVPAFLPRQLESKNEVVKISLEFLEIQSSAGETLGIRWPEKISFSGLSALGAITATTGIEHSVVFSSAKGWVNFLVSQGWAKLVANPDMYVRMGEEASFHSGGEFPVSTSTENYGRTHRHIEWKPFGLSVRVRPQSADSFHISTDIHVEVSEVNNAKAIENIPGLTRRKLDTKMDSEDGETVVLSGLVREANSHTDEGLPLLSAIPLIGYFFSSKAKQKDQTELLMAMTLSLRSRARDEERRENFRKRFESR